MSKTSEMSINKESVNGNQQQSTEKNGDVSDLITSNTNSNGLETGDNFFDKKHQDQQHHQNNNIEDKNQFKKIHKDHHNKHHHNNKRKKQISNITVAFNKNNEKEKEKDETNNSKIELNNINKEKSKHQQYSNNQEEQNDHQMNNHHHSIEDDEKMLNDAKKMVLNLIDDDKTNNNNHNEKEILEFNGEILEKFENNIEMNMINNDEDTLSSPPPPPSEIDYEDNEIENSNKIEEFKLDDTTNLFLQKLEFFNKITTMLYQIALKVNKISKDLIKQPQTDSKEITQELENLKNLQNLDNLDEYETSSNAKSSSISSLFTSTNSSKFLDMPLVITSPFLNLLKNKFSELNLQNKIDEIFQKLNSIDLNFRNFIIEMFINESDWEIKEKYIKNPQTQEIDNSILKIWLDFLTIGFVFLQVSLQFSIVLFIAFIRLYIYCGKCLFRIGKQHLHID
ncbi:hypothetical protein KGF54_004207 [Candida jiufengensis]|uniref:uncharacterized protein n=1 Tax=Candida jiufengensis TaxID=497108 RepID=UPI00222400FD|nr:uncharacterized protein KGF54_004207 [Candida jiufengensis]KAI5951133.1 hypothetical protein KGF54_004207 [Candida jiufengensis]